MTLVGRLVESRLAVAVMSAAPIPLRLVRWWMLRDNEQENRLNSWNRLRSEAELARYAAVRSAVERHAATGFVLDIGCSQGILQEGLRYGSYLGIDSFEAAIRRATAKVDVRTAFQVADATTFRPRRAPDAVVLNEVVYYLPDPLATIEHYATQLAAGGVIIISIYARAWSSRRLLAQASSRLELVESELVRSGHLAWTVAVFTNR